MFWIILTELCLQNNITPSNLVEKIGIARGSVTKWKNGSIPQSSTLQKIADYFGVTVDYLLGKTDQKEKHQEKKTTDEDIKVALFGGDEEVTDEMWEEVKNFVAFVKGKNKK